MITLIFAGLMIFMMDIMVRFLWGITKGLLSLIIMPGFIIGLIVLGLIKFGIPILLLTGALLICRKLLY